MKKYKGYFKTMGHEGKQLNPIDFDRVNIPWHEVNSHELIELKFPSFLFNVTF